MKKRILLLLATLFVLFFTGCANQEETTEANNTLIPQPSYTYYAVVPDETEVTVEMVFFCPTSISKTDLANTSFTLGNTDSIQITDSEVFETYDIAKSGYYYADMHLTLNIQSMTADVLQFNTLSYTLPDQKAQSLHIGPMIIDDHFAQDKSAQFLSKNQEEALKTTPDIEYTGYPDNPNYEFQLQEMYPDVLYYYMRPVAQYTIDGQVYYAFEEEESDYLQDGDLKDLLKASKTAYEKYKEENDAAQALRDTSEYDSDTSE